MSTTSLNGHQAARPVAVAVRRRGPVPFIRDTLLIAQRHLLRTWRVPQIIVFSAIMPVVFVLLFRCVFGGSIHVPGYVDYVDYLIPGIVVQTVLFGGSSTAVGMAEDLASGMTDRLRSLPTHHGAILAARTLADLLRLTYRVALVIAIGLLVGFRFHAGVIPVAEGIAIALLFGYACSWLFALVALTVRHSETAQMGRSWSLSRSCSRPRSLRRRRRWLTHGLRFRRPSPWPVWRRYGWSRTGARARSPAVGGVEVPLGRE